MVGMMRKAGLAVAMAATALTGMTAAAPADAQRWGGYHGGWHGGYGGGWHGGYGGGWHRGGIGAGGAAVLGGLVGLGVGAAIASNHGPYYGPGPYYGRPYYGGYDGGYYAPRCWNQWRWDPYWGREVPVRVCN